MTRLALEPLWVGVVILSELLAVLAVLLYLTGRRLMRLERRHERLAGIVGEVAAAEDADQRQIDLLVEYLRESETRT